MAVQCVEWLHAVRTGPGGGVVVLDALFHLARSAIGSIVPSTVPQRRP